MAIALAVRAWALRFQPWVTVDGTEYIRFAEALPRGEPFSSVFPPGYPALIALARLLVFDRVLAAGLVSLASGALLPWPTWILARRAVGPRWALLPALAVALHPGLALFSTLTMSESAYLLALYGALALAAVERPLPAGLAIGAAFAIRPEALLPAAALAVREATRGPQAAPAARGRSLALAALGFLVLATPCWLYFHATLGEWTLTPKVEALRAPSASWVMDEPRLGGPAPARERFGVLERVTRHGPEAIRHYPANALGHLRSLLLLWPVPLLLLSLWGLVRRRGLDVVPLLHLLAIPALALSAQPRFVLSAIPALAILAALPFTSVSGRNARLAIGAAWLAGAAWCGARNARDLVLPFDGYEQAHKEAGEWLSRAGEPNASVMDRKPYVAFYAERPYRVMPDEHYDTLIDAAVTQGVRYLVVDEGVIRIFRPQLLPLLFDQGARDREQRLEMVYVGGHFKGYGIAIFRVLRPGEEKTGRPPRFDVRWVRRDGQRSGPTGLEPGNARP